jgi:hypothetical protein
MSAGTLVAKVLVQGDLAYRPRESGAPIEGNRPKESRLTLPRQAVALRGLSIVYQALRRKRRPLLRGQPKDIRMSLATTQSVAEIKARNKQLIDEVLKVYPEISMCMTPASPIAASSRT